MPRKPVWVLASVILWASAWRSRAEAPVCAPTDAKPVATVIKAPVTLKEISKRCEELTKEKQALRSATKPATTQRIETATRPIDAATNLWLLMEAYDRLLEQQHLARARLNDLKKGVDSEKLKDELVELEIRTKELTAKLVADRAHADLHRLKEVTERYEKLKLEQDAKVKAHTAREERINGLTDRREEANASVASARKQRDKTLEEFAIRTTTAKAGPDRDRLQLRQRLADLAVEKALADVEMLNLEEQLLNREQRREARRLAALTPHVQALRRWMNALEKATAASELQRIEWHLKHASTDHERLCWLVAKEIQVAYETFESYDNPTRDRFPESELAKLESNITRQKLYWQSFLNSLPRRSGREVLDRYRRVRKELRDARACHDKLSGWLDLSIDDREAVYLLRDKVTEEVTAKRDRLRECTAELPDEQASKFRSQSDERWRKLTRQMDSMVALQNALIERLAEAVEMNGRHMRLLDRTRSRLYWAHLMVPDQGLAWLDPGKIQAEWAESKDDLWSQMRSALELGSGQLRHASVLQWAIAVLLLGGSLVLGWYIHRRATEGAARFEAELGRRIEEEGIEAAGISDRLWFAGTHLAAETPLLVCPLLAVMIDLPVLGLSGLPFRVLSGAALFALAIRLSFGVVHSLFLPARPRFRIVGCSNKVARHYRRWLRGLLSLTILAAPLPLLCSGLDVMLVTRTYLWQAYKTAALLTILLFVLRKRLALKVVGRPENLRAPWMYSVVARLYPMIPTAALGLLVLEILGYSALTTYVIRNIALSCLILAAGMILIRHAADWARQRRIAFEQGRAYEESSIGPGGDLPSSAAISAGQEVALVDAEDIGEREFLAALAASLFGWLVRLVGLALVLRVWGITLVEVHSALTYPVAAVGDRAVTLWRVLAVAAVIVLSVLVSKSLRSILNSKVYPVYQALDRGGRAAINAIMHYSLLVLGIYVAMQLLYINLGALTVLMGTLGLGLGLGLQPLFVNFISGLIILFERHLKVGDVVEVGDKLGEVTGIRMRSTSIKTFDNIDMVIPNGELITKQVVNWSLQSTKIRRHLDVGVAYGSDAELVRKLLLRIAEQHPAVLKDPAPMVWFTDFGNNALTFRLLVWFPDISQWMTCFTELRFAIDRAFAEHGITIPFPQRTLGTIGDKPLRVELAGERSS